MDRSHELRNWAEALAPAGSVQAREVLALLAERDRWMAVLAFGIAGLRGGASGEPGDRLRRLLAEVKPMIVRPLVADEVRYALDELIELAGGLTRFLTYQPQRGDDGTEREGHRDGPGPGPGVEADANPTD